MNTIITYIPHGINENFFYPIRLKSKKHTFIEKQGDKEIKMIKTDEEITKEVSDVLFGEDKPEFVVLYVNRNIRRKRPGDVILAFKTFCDTLPEEQSKKCCLVMHTQPIDGNGTDLPEVARKMCSKYRVVFSANRMDSRFMNALFNIADVTMNLASNEGFGLGTAESLMSGTPIIVSVTGGLQDQCGFVDENGSPIRHDIHFSTEWVSNHDGKYREHGEWAIPLFPEARGLMGSPPTPYIFDDFIKFEDAAIALKRWYETSKEERNRVGELGREFMFDNDVGMTASDMSRRFIHDIEYTLENRKPRKRFTIFNATDTLPDYPEGYSLQKEII